MHVLTFYTFGFDFNESADGLHLLSVVPGRSSQTLLLLHSQRGGQKWAAHPFIPLSCSSGRRVCGRSESGQPTAVSDSWSERAQLFHLVDLGSVRTLKEQFSFPQYEEKKNYLLLFSC